MIELINNGVSMVRLLISAGIHLLANALGLLVASFIVEGLSIDFVSGFGAVLIFTIVEVLAGPLLLKITISHLPALSGGIALVTTLVGLVVTDALSDGLNIDGIDALLASTFLVWLFTLLSGLLLPLVLVKKTAEKVKAN